MVTASEIRLVVMTIHRWPEYLHGMLASLFMSDPLVHRLKGVHLVMGNAEAQFLEPYFHHRRLTIHAMPPAEAERIANWPPLRRIAFNYHRSLTLPPRDCAGFCICENDVIFRDGFLGELLEALNGIEAEGAEQKYMLDGYHPYGATRMPGKKPSGTAARFYAGRFYGSQCIYYPMRVVEELAAYIYEQGVVKGAAPIDLLLGRHSIAGASLFGTARSLVQHVGFHTSNPGAFFHQAPSFSEDVPLVEPFPIEAGAPRLGPVRFELRDSFANAVRVLGWAASSPGTELVYLCEADIQRPLIGDCELLVRVVSRLTRDAIAVSRGGEVVLRIAKESEEQGRVLLRCSIFDSRNQVKPPSGAPENGAWDQTLAGMVQELGARLWWEPRRGGDGLVCQILAGFSHAADEKPRPIPSVIHKLRGRRVLAAAANAANRKLLALLLTEFGADAVCAEAPEDALQQCHRASSGGGAYWLAIVDADMPGMDWLELTRRMRSMPGAVVNLAVMIRQIPSSTISLDHLRAQFHEAGIGGIIAKPVLQSELRQALLHFIHHGADVGNN